MAPNHLDNWEKHNQPANRLTWRGRVDGPTPARLHEITECIDLLEEHRLEVTPNTYGILGFACDEGVRRNLGHTGAAAGPDIARGALANVPIGSKQDLTLYDFGNVACYDDDMEGAQDALAHVVEVILQKKVKPILIGGGHETSWGHYQGIRKAYPEGSIGIINFDAHFDLRPLDEQGRGSSGTPFLQIAEFCHTRNEPFDYTVIGIQSVSNTEFLFEQAERLGVNYVLADELNAGRIGVAEHALDAAIERNDMLYVTLCMDCLAAAFAPGVSAPQPFGIDPRILPPLLQRLIDSEKVVSFDICELCPPRDRDSCTAQLAAALIGSYLHH